MQIPQIDVSPGDSIDRADERVERAFEAVGAELVAFENLNTALSCARSCHFFQASLDGEQAILVVNTAEWSEDTTITVLNILLELRLDPDPPGSRPLFHFYSAHEVPEVLELLFGDDPICEFECRACLVARFGHELDAAACQQLGAVASFLGQRLFDLPLRVGGEDAEGRIVEGVCDHLRNDRYTAEPLNSLIVLGCLYGENLRAQLDWETQWRRIRQFDPWPALVCLPPESSSESEVDADVSSPDKTTVPQIAFSPVAHVIQLFRSADRGALARATSDLKAKCQ